MLWSTAERLNLPNRASNYIFPLNISFEPLILSKAREIFGISELATHTSTYVRTITVVDTPDTSESEVSGVSTAVTVKTEFLSLSLQYFHKIPNVM